MRPGFVGPNTTLIGDTELPYQSTEGSSGPSVVTSEVPPPASAAPARQFCLADLYRDGLMLYHPGLVPLLLQYDPVQLLWAESQWPETETPYRITLPPETMAGAPRPYDGWLFAAAPDYAPWILRYLGRMAFSDPTTQQVWRTVHQIGVLTDPLAPPGQTPGRVPVHLFGLENDNEAWLWRVNSPSDQPRRVRLERVRPKPAALGVQMGSLAARNPLAAPLRTPSRPR